MGGHCFGASRPSLHPGQRTRASWQGVASSTEQAFGQAAAAGDVPAPSRHPDDDRRTGKTGTRTLRISRKEGGGNLSSEPSEPSARENSPLFTDDLAADDTADDKPSADDGEISIVSCKPFKNKATDDTDDTDDQIPSSSLGPEADCGDEWDISSYLDQRPRCAQCRGKPDGKEHRHQIGGRFVFLHDECAKFYRREHDSDDSPEEAA